eukprot:6204538-Pleurochrysis_carterae.AAC.2
MALPRAPISGGARSGCDGVGGQQVLPDRAGAVAGAEPRRVLKGKGRGAKAASLLAVALVVLLEHTFAHKLRRAREIPGD